MKRETSSPRFRPAELIIDARRIGADEPLPKGHVDFTYTVLRPPSGSTAPAERRIFGRQRTKLRSGKIVGSNGRFITECLIHNRSSLGCRLRLPAPITLPAVIHFFDDQSERLFQANVMWQKQRDVGIRLLSGAGNPLARAIAQRMKRKFYALDR